MKVSVIVPNYNHGKFLGQRLDSILSQSYRDFELIILDDCSTDDSREIIESYRNRPEVSHIVFNESNSGSPFKQWRKGLELASGDLIWIAESDDYCEPDLLEKLVAPILEDGRCVISYCASDKVDIEGKSSGLHENLVGMDSLNMDGDEFVSEYMSHNVVVNASSVVFRKVPAMTVDNGYDRLGGYGDFMFWIGLARLGRVCYTAEVLNHFRFHSTNTTASVRASVKGARETIVTDRFLRDEDIISKVEFLSRNLSSAYRLRYRCEDRNEAWQQAWDMLPTGNPLFMTALLLKRIKQQIFG